MEEIEELLDQSDHAQQASRSARTDADTLSLQANTTRDKADRAEARVQHATDAADDKTEEA